ncbi:MAG: DUF2062 domain-containing protein [Porticoccaceae bacterium]|jgi:uncharacterized protein (DUF2062 family)
MPKKFLRRYLKARRHQVGSRLPRWLGPLAADPHLFHLNRHSVSVAFFVGLFCALLPLPGQTLIAAPLALLLRCNLPIALALVWITNPLTMAPVLYLTFKLGSWILGTPQLDMAIHFDWAWISQQGRLILLPLVVGGVVAGLLAGATGYLVIRGLWRWTVVREWEARRRKRLPPAGDDRR